MLRPIGALLLFLGCTAAGFSGAAGLRRERELLRAFSGSLAFLRSEIAYGAHSLPEIFSEAAESVPEPLSGLFRDLAASITAFPEERLSEHVRASSLADPIPLPIREAFGFLGAALGGADAAGQLHAIGLCEERIRAAEQSAASSLPEHCRTRRTLGVCLGAVLAILFL